MRRRAGPRPRGAGQWLVGRRRARSGRLQLQVLPESLGLRATHRYFRSLRVFNPKDIVTAEPRDDLLDFVDVHEMRPVYAPEDIRVQTRLQVVQGAVVRRPGYLPCHYVNRLIGQ